ncbi:hypothetical protein GCM10010174_02970 [Kutzneria viridogrisea]
MNVYPFIEAENASDRGNVKRACELLKVSRAAYYAHHTTGPCRRVRDDTALTEKIVKIHDESRGTYGTPRVHAELRAQGHRHSRKRIARLILTVRGSGARTRTRMACCASTFPREPTCHAGVGTSSMPLPPRSTVVHARHSTGRHQPKH